jgi:DNA end-binding protein Ku
MPRPIWTGSIAFGLVNIPVKLYSAIQEVSLDLDMLDRKDHSNIKYKRVNEETGKEVEYANIVKGYKFEGRYIVLEKKDFEAAAAEKTKRIDIVSFVKESEIDPIYYDTTYFLGADKKDQKTYALLRDALKKSGMVGLGNYVLRNKEHLGVIKVYKNALVLSKLHYESEIRNLEDYDIPTTSVKTSAPEIEMAIALIKQLASPFDISQYKDEYTEQLVEFIKKKAKGKAASPKTKPTAVPREVNSLMDQLKASLKTSTAASRRKAKKVEKS